MDVFGPFTHLEKQLNVVCLHHWNVFWDLFSRSFIFPKKNVFWQFWDFTCSENV